MAYHCLIEELRCGTIFNGATILDQPSSAFLRPTQIGTYLINIYTYHLRFAISGSTLHIKHHAPQKIFSLNISQGEPLP
jgi:hypothetical protein